MRRRIPGMVTPMLLPIYWSTILQGVISSSRACSFSCAPTACIMEVTAWNVGR